MRELLAKIDEGVYRVEKALCLLLLCAMSLAVFADVVHRLASTGGPLDRLAVQILPPAAAAPAAMVAALALSVLLVYGAFRTARVARPARPARALMWAVGLTAAGYYALRATLWLFPNGFVWSQTFALSGMLWVGFLGASIATKEGSHLTLEITEFLWRGRAKAYVGRVGALAAATFCAVLAYLCLRYVLYLHQEWRDADGLSGVFDGFEAPKFAVYGILPVTLLTMALRFFARAVVGQPEAGPSIPKLGAEGPGGG